MTGESTVLLIPVGLYFLPALLAISQAHHQRLAIIALNLLLGWIAALVWALTATPRR